MALTERGIDASYYGQWLRRVDNGLFRYTPQELARELTRMAATLDINESNKELRRLRLAKKNKE